MSNIKISEMTELTRPVSEVNAYAPISTENGSYKVKVQNLSYCYETPLNITNSNVSGLGSQKCIVNGKMVHVHMTLSCSSHISAGTKVAQIESHSYNGLGNYVVGKFGSGAGNWSLVRLESDGGIYVDSELESGDIIIADFVAIFN